MCFAKLDTYLNALSQKIMTPTPFWFVSRLEEAASTFVDQAAARSGEQPLGAGELDRTRVREFERDLEDLSISDSSKSLVTKTARSCCAGPERVVAFAGLDRGDLDRRVLGLQELRQSRRRAAGAQRDEDVRDLAFGLSPNFGADGADVGLNVEVILVLIRHDIALALGLGVGPRVPMRTSPMPGLGHILVVDDRC